MGPPIRGCFPIVNTTVFHDLLPVEFSDTEEPTISYRGFFDRVRVGAPNPRVVQGSSVFILISKGLDRQLTQTTPYPYMGSSPQWVHHKANTGPQNPAGHLGPGCGGQAGLA